ncbi:MAG: 2-C-methyl-D-erythritol 2,4-cyclodiphosphate synthase [Bacteroidetes bacterium]|nr:2-C-methyl-D-erythritol 2,4-cyclodiphosphate synthase [Bacteroidota bacterium]
MRVGFGFDSHELAEGRPLKLGGTLIDFEKGLRGHSDGDVVLHALSDAILGACARGDIGVKFRDDDERTSGLDSKEIIKFALSQAAESKMKLRNADLVIVADQPRLNRHYESIADSISEQCSVPPSSISVKSKTTEGTLVSRNAIACFAIVLLEEM